MRVKIKSGKYFWHKNGLNNSLIKYDGMQNTEVDCHVQSCQTCLVNVIMHMVTNEKQGAVNHSLALRLWDQLQHYNGIIHIIICNYCDGATDCAHGDIFIII